MPNPSATPTPVTPPRVPLIDPRTGLIDRTWYMFFVSLVNAATLVYDGDVGPSSESLIASYDAALQALAQNVDTQPLPIDLSAELTKQIEAAGLVDYASGLLSQIAEMQKQLDALNLLLPAAQLAEMQKQIDALDLLPPPSQGTVVDVTATAPVASSSGIAPNISLNAAYGDTLNPYAAKTANFVLSGPTSGAAAAPTFRALVAADVPVLPYVTSVAASVPSFLSISGSPITSSGTLAIGLSGTALPTTSGGTGLTSFTANGVVYASSTSALTTGSTFVFDGTNVGIGTSSPTGLLDVYSNSTFESKFYGDSGVSLAAVKYSTDATSANLVIRKSRGTFASPSAVSSGDTIGQLIFSVYGGTNLRNIASVRSFVETYTSDTDISSNLRFYTAAAGGVAQAERMRITASGNVVAGRSAALATTATDGFLYVPTCAGTPTGTPTTITGMAPIVVNTTNNKLYFYSGGAWRDAGP